MKLRTTENPDQNDGCLTRRKSRGRPMFQALEEKLFLLRPVIQYTPPGFLSPERLLSNPTVLV